MLTTHYISFANVFKHNYIKMYVKNKLDTLIKKFKLSTYNLYNKMIKDYIFKS